MSGNHSVMLTDRALVVRISYCGALGIRRDVDSSVDSAPLSEKKKGTVMLLRKSKYIAVRIGSYPLGCELH